MATTYVGFYRPVSPEVIAASQRETGTLPPAMLAKVRAFPASLPPTCKLIGSWAISGGQEPGVMVAEVESIADLQHVNTYYAGWLNFDWHPTAGVDRSQ